MKTHSRALNFVERETWCVRSYGSIPNIVLLTWTDAPTFYSQVSREEVADD